MSTRTKSTRICSLLLAVALCLSLFSGCGNSTASSSGSAASGSSASAGSTSAAPSGASSASSSASSESAAPKKVTFFSWLNSKSALAVTSYDDVRCMQELEKKFNVDIEWQQPPVGQEDEQFNLMVASQDLPDMIYWPWQKNYPGGPGKAVSDGIIIRLNDHMKDAPALSAIFEKYPDAKKQSVTDDGTMYMFPNIAECVLYPDTFKFAFYQGPVYRKDLADQLGIKQPVSVEDWHTMLTAFKGISKDFIPFTCTLNYDDDTSIYRWCAPFNCLAEFYLENGKVNYGLLSPKFKTFVQTMAKWYSEGLIDKDFLANDSAAFKAKITNGDVGAFIGSLGGNYTTFSKAMETTVPKAHLSPIPWPTGSDGKAYTSQTDVNIIVSGGWGAAITSKCTNVDFCMKLLDYGYTDEGRDLFNMGVYGESYTRDKDGKIVWTPEFSKEIKEKGNNYAFGREAFGFVSSWATLQVKDLPLYLPIYGEQMEGRDRWSKASTDLIVPPISPANKDASTFADIMNRVNTYRDEMIGKMIMGQVPLSDYDSVVEKAKGMGLEQAVEIENKALTEYNSR